MSDIVLSSGIRANLLSLQGTANLIGTTQQRLATGLKVNSALDNPIDYFTASSLNAQAGNLGNLLDAVSNAIQTVQAANNGTVSGLTGSSQFAVTSGNTITISDGTTTATITSTGNVSVQQIINAVN